MTIEQIARDFGVHPMTLQKWLRNGDIADGTKPVGTVADSYDNAMAEAVNGTFKAELIERCGPWKTRTQTEIAIYEWISWYNHTRLHSSIGDVPPTEYEINCYAQINTLTPTGAR